MDRLEVEHQQKPAAANYIYFSSLIVSLPIETVVSEVCKTAQIMRRCKYFKSNRRFSRLLQQLSMNISYKAIVINP